MNKSATPGPWHVSEYSNTHLNVIDAHGIFAEGSTTPIVEQVRGATLEEADANARLIAAAPELRAALVACLDRAMAAGLSAAWPEFDSARSVLAHIDAATGTGK